jgi:hypothetical protein
MKCCVVVYALMVFVSCGLYSFTDTIVVDLPEPPEVWRGVITIEGIVLEYLVGEDTIGSVSLEPEILSTTLRIPKLSVLPVVAIYHTDAPAAALLPAGAVYPWHLSEDGRLKLEWGHGFISSVFLSCTPPRAQAVNVARLTDAVAQRSFGNPWILDPSKLRGAIERGQLGSRSLSKLPVFDLAIPSVEGRWISGNPLDPTITESSGSGLVFLSVPQGVHSFFGIDTRERIGVQADLEGWAVVFSSRGVGSTGSW